MITRYSGSYSIQRFISKKTSRNLPGLFGKFRVVASTWWQPENWYCPNLLAALQVLSRWHAITDIGKFRGLGRSCCPLNNDASVMGACGCQLWVKSWKRKSYSPGVTLNYWHSMPGWAWDPSVTAFGVTGSLVLVQTHRNINAHFPQGMSMGEVLRGFQQPFILSRIRLSLNPTFWFWECKKLFMFLDSKPSHFILQRKKFLEKTPVLLHQVLASPNWLCVLFRLPNTSSLWLLPMS